MEIIKKFGELVAWILSILLGLITLGGIFAGDWGFALFLTVLAIVIAPPVLKKMSAFVSESRFAKGLTIALTAVIFLTIGAVFVGEQSATQERQRVAQEQEAARQVRKEAYLSIKDTVLNDVKFALAKKDYQKAVDLAKPYIGLDDAELEELYAKASGEIQRKANAEAQAAKIIDEVKAYETFLDTAETDFKTVKPSEADLDTIRKTTTTFYALAESLNKARQNKDILSQSDIAYLKGMEKRLSASQARLLPGLRLAFRKRAGELLWEHDAYVSVSGEGNRIINISAGMFAANANIKTAQEQLQEVLTRLRFKEVRYRWYKEADEFTYYKLDTPPDAKLAYLQHGQFQDIAAGY
jgi:hypothetical protein